MSQSSQERFETAQSIQFDINSISEIKLGAAANNTGAGIVRVLYSESINLRPETEDSLNQDLMNAINSVLDSYKTELQSEFEGTMNPVLS